MKKKQVSKTPILPQLSPQQKEQYEKELAWCIHQLELGLQRPNVDESQKKESNKVINKLKSNTQSIIQKRHLMTVVFGDYRKFMRDEEKEAKKNASKQQQQQQTETVTINEEEKKNPDVPASE